MYVHVGNNVVIRQSEIIAVLDKKAVLMDFEENSLLSKIPEKELSLSWKSLIITGNQLYLSPLSTGTLKKRIRKFI